MAGGMHQLPGEPMAMMGSPSRTPEYIFTFNEALRLAMADGLTYFGDPDFYELPIDTIISGLGDVALIEGVDAALRDLPQGVGVVGVGEVVADGVGQAMRSSPRRPPPTAAPPCWRCSTSWRTTT